MLSTFLILFALVLVKVIILPQCSASFKKLLLGATNKSKHGNCLSKDHIDIVTYPTKTKDAVDFVSTEYDLDEIDSWVDVYDQGLHLESDFKKNVSTYISGYIQRKLQGNYPCVYCQDFLRNCKDRQTCDLIEKNKIWAALPDQV